MAIGLDRQRRRVAGAAGRLALGAAAAGAMTMSPAAIAARPAASGGQAGGKPAIEIHIHQRPGEDAQDLASRVADELERRQVSAARRSYEDGN